MDAVSARGISQVPVSADRFGDDAVDERRTVRRKRISASANEMPTQRRTPVANQNRDTVLAQDKRKMTITTKFIKENLLLPKFRLSNRLTVRQK